MSQLKYIYLTFEFYFRDAPSEKETNLATLIGQAERILLWENVTLREELSSGYAMFDFLSIFRFVCLIQLNIESAL